MKVLLYVLVIVAHVGCFVSAASLSGTLPFIVGGDFEFPNNYDDFIAFIESILTQCDKSVKNEDESETTTEIEKIGPSEPTTVIVDRMVHKLMKHANKEHHKSKQHSAHKNTKHHGKSKNHEKNNKHHEKSKNHERNNNKDEKHH
ncbi:PREDICTED: uncharacterized protein LOC108569369 [Nicrophorus vespilloides]|uniref:Uncharacterized protein LOC108569369 n=1 Tax=Nicrophorus vespilloides TaxID=110193 RepID=A0ABM1NHS8_NICVS|nr:PREDICTED: uncharacterized protein LOC108569369 [Nicrophorus vespilloides]